MIQFIKIEDKYSLTNEGSEDITYTISILEDCINYSIITEGTIPPEETVLVDLQKDGNYVILVEGEEPIEVKHYPILVESIVKGMKNEVCGCNCGCDCAEETDSFCGLLMLRAKIDVFKRLINPLGDSFFTSVEEETNCLILKPVYCAVNSEIILGEAECNEKLIKQMIALDYLAMYFYELSEAETEDMQYVKDKYNINPIFCCIQSLGIDVGKIENSLKNR